MSTLDNILIQKYKTMIGLGYILTNSNGTILLGDLSINSNLNISGSTILYNTTINSSLYVNNNILYFNNVTINSNLTVSGSTKIQNTITVLGNLYVSNKTSITGPVNVSGTSIIYNASTVGTNMTINGPVYTNNGIITTNIYPSNNQIMNINGNIITIGDPGSILNIIGTSNFIATSNLNIADKLLYLNLNANTVSAYDIGNYSGIEILGISGTGFIKTNIDATKFQIATPLDGKVNYIATQDMNNNFYISGTTVLINSVSTVCNLYVSGQSIIKGSSYMKNNLYVTNSSTLNNDTTIGGNLYISSNAIIMENTTIMGNLSISNSSLIQGNITMMGNLTISGRTSIQGNMTIQSKLNINKNLLIEGSLTSNSSLFIANNLNIYGKTTFGSNLNINNSSLLYGSTTIGSNLTINNNTILFNQTTFNSNVNITGNAKLNGNITLGSNISNFYILSNIISKLPEYADNATAKAGGIPVWGFYRTGGIIKICLDDIPPTLTLLGGTTVSLLYGIQQYIDPGIIVTDNYDTNIPVYMIAVNSNMTNILSNPMLIQGTTTSIVEINTFNVGNYTAVYQAQDTSGNIAQITRMINLRISYFTKYASPTNLITSRDIDEVTTSSFHISNLQNTPFSWSFSTTYMTSSGLNKTNPWLVMFRLTSSPTFRIIQFNFNSNTVTGSQYGGNYNNLRLWNLSGPRNLIIGVSYNGSSSFRARAWDQIGGTLLFDESQSGTINKTYPFYIYFDSAVSTNTTYVYNIVYGTQISYGYNEYISDFS